jgi:repressor LexA
MNEQDFNVLFSKNLKFYLQKYDYTQAALAQRLGVSSQTISNWCNGIKIPRMNKVDAMCEIFHCRRSDLMEEHSLSEPEPDITQLLIEHYGPAAEGMIMYSTLDTEDRAEIKGEMKQMLKSDKYKSENPFSSTAAFYQKYPKNNKEVG